MLELMFSYSEAANDIFEVVVNFLGVSIEAWKECKVSVLNIFFEVSGNYSVAAILLE